MSESDLDKSELVRALHERKILLIGEMTNNLGPYADDHFVVLVESSVKWYEFSFDDPRYRVVLEAISESSHYHLELMLANSVENKSIVLWPRCMRGETLFRMEPSTKKAGCMFSILQSLRLVESVKFVLADEVVRFLEDDSKG